MVCPTGKFCDFNNDGSDISSSDITIFANYIGGPATNGTLDYTNDGAVNASDSAFLVNLFASDSPCPSGKFCDLSGDGDLAGNDVTIFNNRLSQYDYLGDGRLNYFDVNFLVNVVSGLACPVNKICDIDGNRTVDGNDVTLLGNYVGRAVARGQIDYNNDGSITTADVTFLRTRFFAGDTTCPSKKFCDFNNDGSSVSSADVAKFTLYVPGT